MKSLSVVLMMEQKIRRKAYKMDKPLQAGGAARGKTGYSSLPEFRRSSTPTELVYRDISFCPELRLRRARAYPPPRPPVLLAHIIQVNKGNVFLNKQNKK